MLLHRSMTTRSKSSARAWTAARKRQRGGGDRVQESILLIWHCVYLLKTCCSKLHTCSYYLYVCAMEMYFFCFFIFVFHWHWTAGSCGLWITPGRMRGAVQRRRLRPRGAAVFQFFGTRSAVGACDLTKSAGWQMTSDIKRGFYNIRHHIFIDLRLHRGYKRLWAKIDLRLHRGFTR